MKKYFFLLLTLFPISQIFAFTGGDLSIEPVTVCSNSSRISWNINPDFSFNVGDTENAFSSNSFDFWGKNLQFGNIYSGFGVFDWDLRSTFSAGDYSLLISPNTAFLRSDNSPNEDTLVFPFSVIDCSVLGCMDKNASNFNPSATVDDGSCQYPSKPQPITGFFASPLEVASGSYNWNMTLNLSQSGHIDDIQSIQLWDAFRVISATSQDNTIVLALEPSVSPLTVSCVTYTVTIPGGLIQGNDGVSANLDPITGSFSVFGCPTPTESGAISTGSLVYGSGLSQSGSFLALVRKDEAGNSFLSLSDLTYLLGFVSFFFMLFYVIFHFVKKSFLGKN